MDSLRPLDSVQAPGQPLERKPVARPSVLRRAFPEGLTRDVLVQTTVGGAVGAAAHNVLLGAPLHEEMALAKNAAERLATQRSLIALTVVGGLVGGGIGAALAREHVSDREHGNALASATAFGAATGAAAGAVTLTLGMALLARGPLTERIAASLLVGLTAGGLGGAVSGLVSGAAAAEAGRALR